MTRFTDRLYKRAIKTVSDKGARIAFHRSGASNYDETREDAPEVLPTVIPGWAVEIVGDPEEYIQLGLIAAEPVTLIFVPDVIGQLPDLSATALWAGRTRSVTQIYAYRPQQVALAARVIIA